jgi:hypothetical protein
VALLFAIYPAACHKEEQAVVGVAQTAVKAEQKAQATATVQDNERAQLATIPLPTKSMYVDIHEPSAWANPFISVGPDMISLRVTQADAADLAQAVAAIPPSAWRYGRVIAVAEAPASPKDRPKVRRNVESAIQQLNDLGIVVEEWPGR